MSINKAMISGNLAKDATLRQTNSGNAVANFTVAVNDRYRTPEGQWDDYTNWIDCTLFGNRATALHKYLLKGTKVCVEGSLRWTTWNDKETGNPRSKVGITVSELEFMSRNNNNGGGGNNGGNDGGFTPPAETAPYTEDEDIPF